MFMWDRRLIKPFFISMCLGRLQYLKHESHNMRFVIAVCSLTFRAS